MTTIHPGTRAGLMPPSSPGSARVGTGPYRLIAILTAILMGVGGLALTAPIASADAGTQAAATDDLNLRSAPALNAEIIDVIPSGAVIELRGDAQNGFYPISYDGNTGWVSADFLVLGGAEPPATETPAAETPAAPGTSVDGSDGYTEDELIQVVYEAADRYGQPREDMLRVARCESVLDPNAVNSISDASGLFQFLPSTWVSTPYADQDIFDPVANANAAAWMWSEGRRNEWTCQ